MRAWYGKGRYWFVVAASESASTAWGWHGYKARWEPLGREFLSWSESDFADAIEFATVPADLIEALAETIDRIARTAGDERFGGEQGMPSALH
jgi:hypothetical protein